MTHRAAAQQAEEPAEEQAVEESAAGLEAFGNQVEASDEYELDEEGGADE